MCSSNKNQTDTLLERYLRLIDISRDLSSTLDLDILLFQIVKAAADLTDSHDASILLYDETKHELYFQSSTNLDAMVMRGLIVPVEGSITGEILTSRKPIVVMNVEDDPRHYPEIGETIQYKTESLLGVPLMTKEKVVGVLEVLNKNEGEFTKEDEEILYALGSQAAVAIENTRLFQQSDLIAEMVHEFRTPLSSISTASHLMMQPEISQKQRAGMAEIIKRETNRLSEMATSFLDLARLESGRSPFNMQEVELENLLRESVEIMESRIQAQGLKLKWDLEDDTPSFKCDRNKIKQVVLNLLSNAIKYNRPKGTIIVGSSSDKEKISFFIKDTGRGMLPEYLEPLFQKFYRIPGSEEIAKGAGLGLSISKKIVEGHGGNIEVTSEPGKGTTFTVALPFNR